MLQDPYAVLRALLRAEAARSTPKPHSDLDRRKPQQPPKGGRGDRG
ncbi:hypothetical protein SAMN06272771_3826 [Streptomyces sp. Ag82_O1-12]|nr:hypothetical protein SAMN06272771_3826 [Streptomyces sp. Ag82_O1-12]SOD46449.1 hypothetical protein SAMN06272727_3824 [Streptomyces sp. Ag82_G6-1]